MHTMALFFHGRRISLRSGIAAGGQRSRCSPSRHGHASHSYPVFACRAKRGFGILAPHSLGRCAAEDAVDSALTLALDSMIARDTGQTEWVKRPRASWPDECYRQYAGLTYRHGRRTIYINGFAVGWPRELSQRVAEGEHAASHAFARPDWWRLAAAGVCEGGEFLFDAEYDPVSQRVLSLRFNRRA
jgi:hypothetical protein